MCYFIKNYVKHYNFQRIKNNYILNGYKVGLYKVFDGPSKSTSKIKNNHGRRINRMDNKC
jgi:hypothetical protein